MRSLVRPEARDSEREAVGGKVERKAGISEGGRGWKWEGGRS